MIGFLSVLGVGSFSGRLPGQGASVSFPITVLEPFLAFTWVLDLNSGPPASGASTLCHWPALASELLMTNK